MQETQLNGESLDIVSDNVSKLKELFPEILTEDKIDFEKLKTVLGNYIEEDSERYNFTWKGKGKALRLAQTPSTGTLRPCKEESKNWDTTENLYIEGDNLEVLKLLQKSYYGKIKMIYIDPPYNTGNDFVYPDDYRDNLRNYLEMTRQIDTEGYKLSTNTDASGRFHTNWLNMMYPRLRLARNLLTENGLIFVSIDDNEVHNLRMIMNDTFGESNFIGQFAWRKKVGAGADSKLFFRQHEYILLYGKNIDYINELYQPLTNKQKKEYSNPDNDSRGPWAPTDLSAPAHDNDPKRIYNVKSPSGKEFKKCWSYTKENFEKLIKDNLIWWGPLGESLPKRKRFLKDKKGLTPRSWIDFYLTSDGKKDLKKIKMDKAFGYPKPEGLIHHLLTIGTSNDDIIMDFFSGSATTAAAVLKINKKTQSQRKFIMVQMAEPISEKEDAYKDGYENICDIGKERIRRVGDRIISETEEFKQNTLNSDQNTNKNLDIGFRVFKLDSSNLAKWDPEYDNIEQKLLDSVENIVPGRTELDLIYEIMLKYGIDLTLPIQEYKVYGNKTIYSIGFGTLLICLNDNIKAEFATEIIKVKEELSPEIMRVVFKDNGFTTDSDKTNIKETLKTNGIEEFVTI